MRQSNGRSEDARTGYGKLNWMSRFIIPLLVLLALPTAFNACKGGGILGGSFSAAKKSCKSTLIDGQVYKTIIDESVPPEAFSAGKVKLREDAADASVRAKVGGSVTISSGTELGVLIDNLCAQEHPSEVDDTLITRASLAQSNPLPELSRQTYLWKLERDYTDTEIETLANQERCVIGISWNREYKMQASYNDSAVYDQYSYLNAIRALQAHDVFYNATGGMDISGTASNSVKIAVIDTGIDWQHPDLTNNLWSNANGIGVDITTTCTGCGPVNYNPFDVSDIGHGTHVAGLIAAVANNNAGIVGTMPYRARIMAIKLFALNSQGELTTTSQHFANAVRFAYQNGAQVINLSLSSNTYGPATDSLAESAVADAIANKVTVIVVVGNSEGSSPAAEVNGTSLTAIPGMYATRQGVIGVGSFDTSTGAKSSFSNYSTTYGEISAPGGEQGLTGIYSTKPRALGAYGRLAGTSQAAPLVSAAAGLAIGIIKDAYGVSPDPTEVENLILSSAIRNPSLAPYFKSGNRLDLLSLSSVINQKYPLTRSPASVNLSSQDCP